MNQQTIELLTRLADQLGTTTEFIWAALVRQAPVSAVIELIGWVLAVLLLHATPRFMTTVLRGRETEDSIGEIRAAVMLCCFFVFVVLFMAFFSSGACSRILAGFLNPEYWALRELLTEVRR